MHALILCSLYKTNEKQGEIKCKNQKNHGMNQSNRQNKNKMKNTLKRIVVQNDLFKYCSHIFRFTNFTDCDPLIV